MAGGRKLSVVSVDRSNDGVLRIDDEEVHLMSNANPDIAARKAGARHATDKEHDMTVRDALKLYWKGVSFSLLFSLAVIMVCPPFPTNICGETAVPSFALS